MLDNQFIIHHYAEQKKRELTQRLQYEYQLLQNNLTNQLRTNEGITEEYDNLMKDFIVSFSHTMLIDTVLLANLQQNLITLEKKSRTLSLMTHSAVKRITNQFNQSYHTIKTLSNQIQNNQIY